MCIDIKNKYILIQFMKIAQMLIKIKVINYAVTILTILKQANEQ